MAEKNRIWHVGGNTFLIAMVSAEDMYMKMWSNDQHKTTIVRRNIVDVVL